MEINEPEFTIYSVCNGVIVVRPHPMMDGTVVEVFEHDDEQPEDQARLSEMEMAEKVVWSLLDAMGWQRDKHSKYNLIVEIEGLEG